MADYTTIREQIRILTDPKFLALREELFGSGISYGRIQEAKLPPTTVVVGGGGGTTDPGNTGFIEGIAVYSGGTLIASNRKELSFIGPAISTAGNRATIDFSGVLSLKVTNPMTTAGDIIYGGTAGVPTRRAIGSNGQYLSVVAGLPTWVTLASGTGGTLTDPTTTIGDLLYRSGIGVTRLGIGSDTQVLQVSGGEPIWADAPLTGLTNPMTTAGDLIRGGVSGTPTRVAIGTEGYRLAVSGGTAQWAPLPPDIGFANPMTTDGDMIYRNGTTTVRLPIASEDAVLTVSGGHPAWKTFSALINPMLAGGDIIYGKYASSFTDEAPAGTATQSSTNGAETADMAIDGNDATSAGMNGGNSTQWLQVDLGIAKAIARFRVLQANGGFLRADAYKLQSSDDASSWVDRYSYTSASPDDTGQVILPVPIVARYWRIWTASSGAFAWNVYTFSLFSGANAGSPERLGVGSPGQVLTVSSGSYPVWATPSGSTGGGVSVSGFTNPMTTLGDIIYAQTSGVATRLGVGSTGQVLTVAGGVPTWTTPSGGGSVIVASGVGSASYVCITDQKSAGTNGGTFTSGAWRTRDLNVELADIGNIASLSSNQITLQAGRYYCQVKAPAAYVNRHKTRLYNVTDAVTQLVGTTEYTSAADTQITTTSSVIVGEFTITVPTVFEVQHRCETTRSTDGFGEISNYGEVEVFTIAEFWREGSSDALSAQAEGDILVGGTSVFERLPIGDEGQVLTVASGMPIWSDPIAGSGGSGGGALFYSVRSDTPHTDSPTPTTFSVVPDLSVTIPGAGADRTFLVSYAASFTASHPNHFTVFLDSTIVYPKNGLTTYSDSVYPTSGPSDSTPTTYDSTLANFAVTIPGDAADHVVSVQYTAALSTADTTFYARSLAAVGQGSVAASTKRIFRARMGSTQSVPNGTVTKLPFNTEELDIGGHYDAVTNFRWTPPAGIVEIALTIEYTTDTSSTAQAIIYKNGTGVSGMYSRQGIGSSVQLPTAVYYDVADGTDYYEAVAVQFGGGTMTVNNSDRCIFQGIAFG